MANIADQICNPAFNNWVKSALTLDSARDALKEFVETNIKSIHESLIQNILATCSLCDFNTCEQCQNKTCTNKQLKNAIQISHVQKRPSFGYTSPKECWSQPWQFAKCFMPPNVYQESHTAEDTDLPGLISVIVNNYELREKILSDLKNFIQARGVRNEVMHNPGIAVDNQTFKDNISVINTMLNCLPSTDKRNHALKRISELSRYTITMTDIASVFDKAIASLGRHNHEIKDSIQEMLTLSKSCKQVIKDKETTGVKKIENKTEEGVGVLHETTKHGINKIKTETANATDKLNVQKKEAVDALESKANKEKSQLCNLHRDKTIALKKTAEEEREEMKKRSEQEQNVIKGEQQKLKIILNDCFEKLDSDINLIRKKAIESENVRGEISASANKIQQTTDTCVTTVQAITKACLESLYKETDLFRTRIRETQFQSEQDTRKEIESLRTEFSDKTLEVLREISVLKSEMVSKFIH